MTTEAKPAPQRLGIRGKRCSGCGRVMDLGEQVWRRVTWVGRKYRREQWETYGACCAERVEG